MPYIKQEKMKCGFCGEQIDRFKDLMKYEKGRKVILSCPKCFSILGVYYA
jgi:uncharacterized Zn finger protein